MRPSTSTFQIGRPTLELLKLDGEGEAKLIAMRLGKPPAGYGRWTLQLLADELVALEVVDSISHETVRSVLKKKACRSERSSTG